MYCPANCLEQTVAGPLSRSPCSCPAAGGAAAAAPASASGEEACQRAQFLQDNPALMQKFSADLLPLMIKVR
jgi:hypothetical protein